MVIFISVNACARNGMGFDAVELYRRMPEKMRDTVSHVCVLNACSHAGLLNEARIIFDGINDKTEKVVATMVRSLLVSIQTCLIKPIASLADLDRLSDACVHVRSSTGTARSLRAVSPTLDDHVQYVFILSVIRWTCENN